MQKTQSVYKKKNRGNKNKSIKKKGKRIWLYNVGNISLAYRTPRLHIKPATGVVGGGADDATDVNRKFAASIIESIKKQAKDKVSKKELEIIEKTLNKENVCEASTTGVPGIPGVPKILSSMTTKAFNGMSEGAVSLGKFLAPVLPENNIRRRNDTTIQMLWYPQTTDHYRKGNSVATPKDKIRYGDFMIYIEPERYADMNAYISNVTNPVEDLLTNVLNGCSDSLCLKGNPIPDPYKHQIYKINNYQPDADDKALQVTSLKI